MLTSTSNTMWPFSPTNLFADKWMKKNMISPSQGTCPAVLSTRYKLAQMYGESCELEQGKKVQVITVIIGEVQWTDTMYDVYKKGSWKREREHNNAEKKKMSWYQLTRIHRFSIKLMKQWQFIKIKVPWLNWTFSYSYNMLSHDLWSSHILKASPTENINIKINYDAKIFPN